jgi:hypothetical protein
VTAALVVVGAVVICLVPWFKWAVTPVSLAFELGRLFEKIRACNPSPRDGSARQ